MLHKGDVVVVHRRHAVTYAGFQEGATSSYTFGLVTKATRSGSVLSVLLASGARYHVAPGGQQIYATRCPLALFEAARTADPFNTLEDARAFARPFRPATSSSHKLTKGCPLGSSPPEAITRTPPAANTLTAFAQGRDQTDGKND